MRLGIDIEPFKKHIDAYVERCVAYEDDFTHTDVSNVVYMHYPTIEPETIQKVVRASFYAVKRVLVHHHKTVRLPLLFKLVPVLHKSKWRIHIENMRLLKANGVVGKVDELRKKYKTEMEAKKAMMEGYYKQFLTEKNLPDNVFTKQYWKNCYTYELWMPKGIDKE